MKHTSQNFMDFQLNSGVTITIEAVVRCHMLIDALQTYEFMRYSFISGIIVGLIAPLLGTFIVVRRLSLIADALSHISLGGITFGVYITSVTGLLINPL